MKKRQRYKNIREKKVTSQVIDIENIESRLREKFSKIVSDMGFILVDFYIKRGKMISVNLEIYHSNRDVSIRDCEKVSNVVSRILDVEDLIPVSYTLFVSSPGIDKAIKTDRDYQIFAGKEIEIVLSNYKFYGLSSNVLVGKLLGKDGDVVKILANNREFWIDFSDVSHAKLYFDLHNYLRGGSNL